MTSKNSIYKMTLEHLRHSGWMIALSFIGNLFAGPVILLFEYSNRDYDYLATIYDAKEFLFYKSSVMVSSLADLCGSTFLAVSMIGALIVALGIFYYLFQSSKVDLYHSLPLTRNELFYSGYLAGLLIWFVPFILNSLITLPLAIFCAGGFAHINMLLVAFLKMLAIPTLGFIIIYHLCLVTVMLSGNMSNTIIATLVWGTAPIVFYLLFNVHFEQYFDTFHKFTINEFLLCAFAPVVAPIIIQVGQMDDNMGNMLGIIIFISLLIAAINFLVARGIYQKRKSELAGRGMENKVAALLTRTPASIAAGLFGVIFLYFVGISNRRVLWSIFFCVFFSVFTFAVLSAVQKKTVKALFAHKAQMVVTAAFSMGFILACHFDIFGYDTYLPAKDNIASCEIRISAMNQYYYYDEDNPYTYHNPDVIYDILTAGVEKSEYANATSVTVKVIPKSGFSYYRSYYIPMDKVETLRPIIEDDDYFAYIYQDYIDNANRMSGVYLHDLTRGSFQVEDATQAEQLWQAYHMDLQEHCSMEEQTSYIAVGDIEFSIRENDSENYCMRDLPIKSTFRYTLAYLKEHYPNLALHKDDLKINELRVNLSLGTETTVEEYYQEMLTPSGPVKRGTYEASEDYYFETYATIEPVADYECSFSPEELTWLYNYLEPSRDHADRLNADNYYYFGEIELNTGVNISCYIKKGTMTDSEISTLATIVNEKKRLIEY
ncbi:MAG: hypothetical protein IJZ82_11345 [Lachnospiraceae bacterium]|nr:hypothetical protein [Lachnospiraceae bacterium]